MRANRVVVFIVYLIGFLFYSLCQAAVYRVDDINEAAPFYLYRDVANPNSFYFLPRAYTVATTATQGKRIGVQIFSEDKKKGVYSAALTLSVGASVAQGQLSKALERLKQRYLLSAPTVTPPSQIATRLSAYRSDDLSAPVATTKWANAPVEGSQTISFTVAHADKSTLLKLLSGEEGGIVIVVENQISDVIDGVASAQIVPRKLADLANGKRTIAQGPDLSNFVNDVMEKAVDASTDDKLLVRDTVRSWVVQHLGQPKLLRAGDKLVYGWDLSKNSMSVAEDNSLRVLLGTPHSEMIGAVVEIGNVCANIPTAILNLDDGSTGCGSLR